MCVPGDCRTRQAARPASVPARGAPLGCAGYRCRMLWRYQSRMIAPGYQETLPPDHVIECPALCAAARLHLAPCPLYHRGNSPGLGERAPVVTEPGCILLARRARGQMQSLVGLSGVEPVSPGPCPVFSLNYKPKLGW